MNKIILSSFLLLTTAVFSQNDSITRISNDSINSLTDSTNYFDESSLDELTIEFRRKIKLKQNGGKYEVQLEGTNFNRFSDVWEGMKNIPMLRVIDNQELSINGKTPIVEIDGIRTELSGEQLESYLRSLGSDTVKSIELITNPSAMYDSNVAAVVNIILKKQEQQYRFSINENGGFRTKPFSYTNLNYSQNLKKLYIYTNYNFGYNTITSESKTEIYTLQNGNQAYRVDSDYISRSHNVQLNLVYSINEKNKIFLTNLYTHGSSDSNALMSDDTINRKSTINSNSNFLRLSQIWKSNLSDKLTLKLGSYQIINQSETEFSAVQNSTNQRQALDNKTPIVIGFADLNLTSKLGVSDFGSRFHSINQKNENKSFINQDAINAPFYYNEKVLSFYLNHTYQLNEKQSFVAGVRSESTFSDYSFNNSLVSQSIKDKQEYTNLMYNLGFYWNNEKVFQSISFRKQISRPNYSYLNPFRSLSEDITQQTGDLDIKPALQYSLNYELVFGKFVYSLSGTYVHNFISSFMEEEDGVIVTTYKNFKKVYFLNTGIEYNAYLFNDKWNLRPTLYVTLPKMVDSSYDIKKSSPIVSFGVQNIVNLDKNYMFTLYYSLNPSYRDGLLKHRYSQMVNVSFSKKLNNFNFIVYANDIFKTNKSGLTTLLDNYKYHTVSYNDTRNIGLSVRYTFAGKAFKAKEMESINDNTLNRL